MSGGVAPRFDIETEIMVTNMVRAVSLLSDIEKASSRALVYACVQVPAEFAQKHDSEALRRARIYRDRIKQEPR